MALVADITEADFFGGLSAFLLAYATPALKDEGCVVPGYLNDQPLPEEADFCIYTPISAIRHGTTIEEWSKVKGEDTVDTSEYLEVVCQIDCYSSSPVRAMKRATTYESMIRSESGVNFLKDYGIASLYADTPSNLTGILDSGKYQARWTLQGHFGLWKKLTVPFQYFDALSVEVVNVDTRFPPE